MITIHLWSPSLSHPTFVSASDPQDQICRDLFQKLSIVQFDEKEIIILVKCVDKGGCLSLLERKLNDGEIQNHDWLNCKVAARSIYHVNF